MNLQTKSSNSKKAKYDMINSSELPDDNTLPASTPTTKDYIVYGSGATANGWTAATIGFYLNYYVINTLYLRPGALTIMQIVSQVINAISDPITGLISDRTMTRFGRRRPFILFSSIAMPLTYFLFFTSYGIKNETLVLALYTALFVSFYLTQTFFNVPYLSLVMDLTDDEKERNNFVASATIFFAIGNLFGPLSLILFQHVLLKNNKALVYSVTAGISGIIISALIFIVFIGLKERKSKIQKTTLKQILQDSIAALRYKSYICMTLAYICTQIAVQTIQFNLELYLKVIVKEDLMLFIILPTILSSVFWIWPLKMGVNRFGKRITYLFANIFFTIPFIVILFYTPKGTKGIVVLVLMGMIVGLGTTAGFFLSSCMLNDIIFQDRLLTGNKREGTFNSLYIFCQKISTGLVHGFTGVVLESAGPILRDGDKNVLSDQTERFTSALRYWVCLLPLCAIVVSFLFLYLYPLTREKVLANQKERILRLNVDAANK